MHDYCKERWLLSLGRYSRLRRLEISCLLTPAAWLLEKYSMMCGKYGTRGGKVNSRLFSSCLIGFSVTGLACLDRFYDEFIHYDHLHFVLYSAWGILNFIDLC